MLKRLHFFVPDTFVNDEYTPSAIIHRTNELPSPFLSIMGLRFVHAAMSCDSGMITYGGIDDYKPNTIYVLRDYFYEHLPVQNIDLQEIGSSILLFHGIAQPHSDWLRGGFNGYRYNRERSNFDPTRFFLQKKGDFNELNNIVVPISAAREWLPPASSCSQTILLDEPHATLLDVMANEDDIRTRLYRHALAVCKELSNRGFEIHTFCREDHPAFRQVVSENPFLRVIHQGGWMNYHDTLKMYANHTFFFNYFTETYGFPTYENLQLGNGVVIYSENANMTAMMQMQNSAILSIYLEPHLCADLVTAYFQRFVSCNLRSSIADDAHTRFSTDTFASRLIEVFNSNKALPKLSLSPNHAESASSAFGVRPITFCAKGDMVSGSQDNDTSIEECRFVSPHCHENAHPDNLCTMAFTSNAQNFEDVMLWRALNGVKKGTYIDIGGSNPGYDSVSKAFYEQGWRGIHVEMNPYYAKILRRSRPDELVLHAAISDSFEGVTYYEIVDNQTLSTVRADIAEARRREGYNFVVHDVRSITLDHVLNRVTTEEIHWLKIGGELVKPSLLNGWAKSKKRPWIVVITTTDPITNSKSCSKLESNLLSKGYLFAHFDGLNRYYVLNTHAELMEHFRYGLRLCSDSGPILKVGDGHEDRAVALRHHRKPSALPLLKRLFDRGTLPVP
ncbi:FkbM family methyltransferase [Azospirillum sp. sgz302134]